MDSNIYLEEVLIVRQSEKDIVNQYIYNNYVRLEDTVNNIKNNLRFRHVDVADCMEYICALQAFDTFKEVTGHIRVLLKLNESE